MTRETAINLLDNLIGMVEDNQQGNYDEAFKMAIRSLKSWDEDVAPVVHGKWIKGVCDKCGFDWGKVAPIANVPNYCPNCGARMDGTI